MPTTSINRKGCGRQRSWHTLGYYPRFFGRQWGTPWLNSGQPFPCPIIDKYDKSVYFRQRQPTFLRSTQNGSEVYTASCSVETRVLSQVVKWSAHRAEHSPQSTAQVKNASSFMCIPRLLHMVWWLFKEKFHSICNFLINIRLNLTPRRWTYCQHG
jgi:hypothetical protein